MKDPTPAGAGKAPPPTPDPRLVAVCGEDGALDPSKVEALLNRHPDTLSIAELTAMHTVFFAVQYNDDNPLAGVAYELWWRDAFIECIGGTIVREKVRHGRTIQRSVQTYRGRRDVRRYRAAQQSTTERRRPRSREHRPRAARTSSGSRTSSADPGDSDPPAPRAAPPSRRFVVDDHYVVVALAPSPPAIWTYGCLTREQRGEA